MSLMKIEMHLVYLNILNLMADCYKQFEDFALTEYKNELLNIISRICIILSSNVNKISQQQQHDIGIEIKRMNGIIQLCKILRNPFIAMIREVEEAKIVANDAVISWRVYDEDKALETMKKLQDVAQTNVDIIKLEREMVVKAIGFKAGHWYKCPNGHFYCIGDCGRANQVGKCIECGAKVGGQRYTLEEGNANAPEIVGSRFAHWSNAHNITF